jgi:hypothetical protein
MSVYRAKPALAGRPSGTFNGLPGGSSVILGTFGGTQYSRFIQYGATSVVLSPVPEPAHIFPLAAAATLAWRRRRAARAS